MMKTNPLASSIEEQIRNALKAIPEADLPFTLDDGVTIVSLSFNGLVVRTYVLPFYQFGESLNKICLALCCTNHFVRRIEKTNDHKCYFEICPNDSLDFRSLGFDEIVSFIEQNAHILKTTRDVVSSPCSNEITRTYRVESRATTELRDALINFIKVHSASVEVKVDSMYDSFSVSGCTVLNSCSKTQNSSIVVTTTKS